MKKLPVVLILLCLIPAFRVYAQGLEGKWYMVNRSGLIETLITPDSIITTKLAPDFTSKGQPSRASAYVQTVKLGDRILLIGSLGRDTPVFSAVVFTVKNKYCIQKVWNSPDTLTDNPEAIIELNKKDHRVLFGYNCFAENYIDSLKKMKSIDSMSRSEFMVFLELYLKKLKATETEFEKLPPSYTGGTSHNFQVITQAFYETGFNPIQNTQTLDVLEKYFRDPEVKKIIEETAVKKPGK